MKLNSSALGNWSTFFCFSLMFFFGSCSEKDFVLPIQEESLKEILIDIHLAEAAIQPLPGKMKDSLRTLYFDQIFEIHQVHPVDFEVTMEMLEKNPKEMRRIYKTLTEKIDQKKLKLQKDRQGERSRPNGNEESHQDNPSQSSN